MKLISYNYNLNNINLEFDCFFKQIKIIKFETINENGELTNDEIEMSFSKGKKILNLFINEPKLIIIHVIELDKEKISYSYLIDLNSKSKDKLKDKLKDTIEISNLNKLNIVSNEKVTLPIERGLDIICPIKNQNIFAKITKKVYC